MSVHGFTDDDFELDDSVTLISRLDLSNPLLLHPNYSTALTVVFMKLKGTENNQVWSYAMLLALEGKNKTGFIDGTCRRSNTDKALGRQWDIINAVVLGPIWQLGLRRGPDGKIIDFGANQHMTHIDKNLNNVYDISHFRIKVGHPNETKAFISKIGNLRLYSLDRHQFIFLRDVKFFESVFLFKDSFIEMENVTLNFFQDLNHIYFFDNKYPEIPIDDERVDPSLNGDQSSNSDTSHSFVSGEDVNTIDFLSGNIRNDAQSSDDIHAAQNEQVKYGLENKLDALLRNDTWEITEVPKDRKDVGVFVALLVYVNDIIITSNSMLEIEKFKTFLKSIFMIKDLEKLKYFIGIEVIDTD
ncbi:ribonuclease H-like domain-containing protein [Tanacetum coccineum]